MRFLDGWDFDEMGFMPNGNLMDGLLKRVDDGS
jgi:hypothetical protein